MAGLRVLAGGLPLLVLLCCLIPTEAQSNGTVCSNYNCQKGQCVQGSGILGIALPKCVCDHGWSSFNNWDFLPCLIPNCSLSFSCNAPAPSVAAPAPAPPETPPPVAAVTNPCLISFLCGNGDCVVNNSNTGFFSLPTYYCNCHPGNINVLNVTSGVCIPDCQLGASCQDLGIGVVGGNQPSPPGAPSSAGKRRTEIGAMFRTATLFIAVVLWL